MNIYLNYNNLINNALLMYYFELLEKKKIIQFK